MVCISTLKFQMEALFAACKALIDVSSAKPFVWKKRDVKGSQLKNTIGNLLE